MNDSNGVVTCQGGILGFSLFEYVCEAFADSFMRFFSDFGFQTSSPLEYGVVWSHSDSMYISYIYSFV